MFTRACIYPRDLWFSEISGMLLLTPSVFVHCPLLAYRAMMRDETMYPDAAAFRPERFMEPTTPEMERKMNPKNFVFGFGRR